MLHKYKNNVTYAKAILHIDLNASQMIGQEYF